MNSVTLIKNGLIVHSGKPVEPDPLMYLGFMVELEEGYTLRSFFETLKKYPLLVNLNPFFSTFMKKYSECPESECHYEGFDCLEFSKTVEMVGFPGKPRLEIYNSFRGKKDKEALELKTVSLENILDLPVHLGNLRHVVFGDKVDIFEFETFFNLFEFIDGIAWELSFHGSPIQCEIGR